MIRKAAKAGNRNFRVLQNARNERAVCTLGVIAVCSVDGG